MKIALIFLGLVLALASTAPLFEEDDHHTDFVRHGNFDVMNDEVYLRRYRDVLRLFKYLHQQVVFKDHVDIVENWKIEQHLDAFTKPHVAREFLEYYHKEMLPRDTVFTIYNEDHLKQAIALCKLMYFAKDFETFYKTAVWARYHMNQGMFLYSYSVALLHREDTNTMILPPIYEIYPYYFFDQDLIHKVRDYKQTYDKNTHKHGENFITAKYSDWFGDIQPEHSMTYFTEDMGINQFYYYYNLYRPFWMNFQEFNVLSFNRGEEFYYFHQQLLARYYLESLSNGLGKLDVTNMHSSLYLHEDMKKSDTFNFLTAYEKEIRDMLETGYIVNMDGKRINLYEPRGFEILADYIETNPESTNTHFYGYLQVLARYYISHQEHHTDDDINVQLDKRTWLYDTNFWMFVKKMIMHFQTYKTHLSHYTLDDLKFEGVRIQNVDVSALITYFERFDTELTNALDVSDAEIDHNDYDIRVRQQRLNHKQFTYKIELKSEKAVETVVRVFIGPKYDEQGKLIRLDENRMNFVEFDRFKYQLTTGQNLIERNSRDTFFSVDRISFQQLYRESMVGFTEHNKNWNKYNLHYTFPNRFLLPKGKQDGQMYQFFVMVSPFKAHHMMEMKHSNLETSDNYFRYPIVGLGVQHLDDYPLGYPFDRTINEEAFMVPNMYFKDVTIYHHAEDMLKKHVMDMNLYDSTPVYKRTVKKMDMDKYMNVYPIDKKHMMDMHMDKQHMMDMEHMYEKRDMDYPMYGKRMEDMYMGKKHMMYMDKKPMMDIEHMYEKRDMDYPMYGKRMEDNNMYMGKKHMMYMDKEPMMDMEHMYEKRDMDYPMYGKRMEDNMYMGKKYMMDMHMDKQHMMYMDKKPMMDMEHMYEKRDMDYPMYGKRMEDNMYMGKEHMMDMDKKHMMDMHMDKQHMMYMDKKPMMDMEHMYEKRSMDYPMYGKRMEDNMYMDKKHMMDMYMNKNRDMDFGNKYLMNMKYTNDLENKHYPMFTKHMMGMDTKNMYYPMHDDMDMNKMDMEHMNKRHMLNMDSIHYPMYENFDNMNTMKYMNYPMYNKYMTNYRNTHDMDYNYKNMMLNKHFGDMNTMTPKNMYENDMHMYNKDLMHERPMNYYGMYHPMTKMHSMDMNMDNQMYYKSPYQSTKYTMDLPLDNMDMHMTKDKYDW